MRLLLDQNLSPRLEARLADLFPGSRHVVTVGLDRATDREVWEFARNNDFVLVSKDADFSELSTLLGTPPKVLWLQVGNCATQDVERLLRSRSQAVQDLIDDPGARILTLR